MRRMESAVWIFVIKLKWGWNNASLSLPRQWPVNKRLRCTATSSSDPPLPPFLSSLTLRGWDGWKRCILNSKATVSLTHTSYFQLEAKLQTLSSFWFPPLFILALLSPRQCCKTCCSYTILSRQHNRPNLYLLGASQKAPWKTPQSGAPL